MSDESHHRYKFGAPAGGWPTFSSDGYVVRPDNRYALCEVCGGFCGEAPWVCDGPFDD